MRAILLRSGHNWKPAPGCGVLLIDGGAVRFDCPESWIIRPTAQHVFIIDRSPPDDMCLLAVSWKRMSFRTMAMSALSMLNHLAPVETRPLDERGETTCIFRPPLEAAWTETRFIEPLYGASVLTRLCVARSDCTEAMLLLDYHPDRQTEVEAVWQTILDSLVVGEFFEDTRSGRKHIKRG